MTFKSPTAPTLVKATLRELAEHKRAARTTRELEAVDEELARRVAAKVALDSDVDGDGITHD